MTPDRHESEKPGAQAAETGESVTLGTIGKREDRTVSGASHLTTPHWAQWERESSDINEGVNSSTIKAGCREEQEENNRSEDRRCASGVFLFDLLDRLRERRDERRRVSQVALGDLEFRHEDAVFVHKHQTIALFHGDAPCSTSEI
jgi:hypothetical protein